MTQPNNDPRPVQDSPKPPEFDLIHAIVKHRIEKIFGVMANKLVHLSEMEPDSRNIRVYLDVARAIRETVREEVGAYGTDVGDGSPSGIAQGEEGD